MVPERGVLIRQREKLGLTQEDVAAKAGLTLKQYQQFESHDRKLSSSSFRIVYAVISALELDLTTFKRGGYGLAPVPEDDPLYQIIANMK